MHATAARKFDPSSGPPGAAILPQMPDGLPIRPYGLLRIISAPSARSTMGIYFEVERWEIGPVVIFMKYGEFPPGHSACKGMVIRAREKAGLTSRPSSYLRTFRTPDPLCRKTPKVETPAGHGTGVSPFPPEQGRPNGHGSILPFLLEPEFRSRFRGRRACVWLPPPPPPNPGFLGENWRCLPLQSHETMGKAIEGFEQKVIPIIFYSPGMYPRCEAQQAQGGKCPQKKPSRASRTGREAYCRGTASMKKIRARHLRPRK